MTVMHSRPLDPHDVAPVETISSTRPSSRAVGSLAGRRSLAALRIAGGAAFLVVFVDKAVGLGLWTTPARAWINDGAPSQGLLNSETVAGPLKPVLAAASNPVCDVVFMAAMLAIGVAVLLGIGLRISAVVGAGVMLAMYLAEWSFGVSGGCTNPFIDHHAMYAVTLIAVAVLDAGDTWGLGARWKAWRVVQRNHWLI